MSGIDIKPDAQGKVRDLYDLGDALLLVATDRISAFDYILEDEIPHKGAVLTQLSCFWFELLDGVVENHLISADVADLPEQFKPYADYLRGRFMLVKKADMFPAECIVRGYLAGSGLKEYEKQYELAVVVSAKLEDEERAAVIEKVKNYITRFNGTVTNVDEWGKKRLAYEIQKMREAYYYFIQFEGDSECPNEVERHVRIMESVIRYLCVKQEA